MMWDWLLNIVGSCACEKRHHPRRHKHLKLDVFWITTNNDNCSRTFDMSDLSLILSKQTSNGTLMALDASGAVVTVTYDAPPTWTLTDPNNTVKLVVAADGQSAVATPVAVGNSTVVVTATVGGVALTSPTMAIIVTPAPAVPASLQVTWTVVDNPTPAPAPTAAPANPLNLPTR